MLLLWWCPFKIQNEKWPGLQFTRTDYLSLGLTPLRIRWTIPLKIDHVSVISRSLARDEHNVGQKISWWIPPQNCNILLAIISPWSGAVYVPTTCSSFWSLSCALPQISPYLYLYLYYKMCLQYCTCVQWAPKITINPMLLTSSHTVLVPPTLLWPV